jgi:NADH:ubiquinone oxidoreductase subunit E
MSEVDKHTRSFLLPELQKIQDKKGVISDKDMQALADKFNIHPVEVYSVVTFYSFLTTKKLGKNVIRVSNCISNKMAGSDKVLRQIENVLGIKTGQTTKDKMFTLLETSCIGMCDQAPAVMVNTDLIGKVSGKKIKEILRELSLSKGK